MATKETMAISSTTWLGSFDRSSELRASEGGMDGELGDLIWAAGLLNLQHVAELNK